MIGHNLQRWLCLAALLLLGVSAALAEERPAKPPLPEEPFGIGLEGFPYPYPVRMFTLSEDGERLRMAYMDVRPKGEANGHTVLLLHGRNFPSSYWRPTIEALAGNGYRVVAPDQIGFGKPPSRSRTCTSTSWPATPSPSSTRLAQELAGKMKNARVEAFEGIGHLPQLEAEQRFNEMMLRFLDEGQ